VADTINAPRHRIGNVTIFHQRTIILILDYGAGLNTWVCRRRNEVKIRFLFSVRVYIPEAKIDSFRLDVYPHQHSRHYHQHDSRTQGNLKPRTLLRLTHARVSSDSLCHHSKPAARADKMAKAVRQFAKSPILFHWSKDFASSSGKRRYLSNWLSPWTRLNQNGQPWDLYSGVKTCFPGSFSIRIFAHTNPLATTISTAKVNK